MPVVALRPLRLWPFLCPLRSAVRLARAAGCRLARIPTRTADRGVMAIDKRDLGRTVVYQIYIKSFCDSNGDGIGDLRGIT